MCELHDELEDGIYSVVFYHDKKLASDATYRAEKIKGEWFLSDGTGWKEKIEYPESIVEAKEISHLHKIERNTVYENHYPLTDFFPKTKRRDYLRMTLILISFLWIVFVFVFTAKMMFSGELNGHSNLDIGNAMTTVTLPAFVFILWLNR